MTRYMWTATGMRMCPSADPNVYDGSIYYVNEREAEARVKELEVKVLALENARKEKK